jgi:hypothetical protein
MLLFDKSKRSYTLMLNWMGRQVRIPMHWVGQREKWSFNG